MALKQSRRTIQIRADYVEALQAQGFNLSSLIGDLIDEALIPVELGEMSAADAARAIPVTGRMWCSVRHRAMRTEDFEDAINAALDKAGAP